MRKRIRTNMKGLVSHTTPNSSYMSEESKLVRKFDRGTITSEELRKLAAFMAIRKKDIEPKLRIKYVEREKYFVKCFDSWVECHEEIFNSTPPHARKVEIVQVKTW